MVAGASTGVPVGAAGSAAVGACAEVSLFPAVDEPVKSGIVAGASTGVPVAALDAGGVAAVDPGGVVEATAPLLVDVVALSMVTTLLRMLPIMVRSPSLPNAYARRRFRRSPAGASGERGSGVTFIREDLMKRLQ